MEAATYDPKFFSKIAAVEDRHFWFATRNRVIGAVVKRVIHELPKNYRVLEVGCGTGIVLRELVRICEGGEVTGMDLFPEAVEFASNRAACPVLVGDILNPPELGKFDIVTIFDVLEHLPNDDEIVCGLNRMLKLGGTLILTVPAHMSLWSYFDVAACHQRRYSNRSLDRLLREGGFTVEYLSQFMMPLFPLIWLTRRFRKGAGAKDAAMEAARELAVVPGLNLLLKAILAPEAFAAKHRLKLPIGTSLLAIASKAATAG